jgi:outer membrane protein TolC
MPFAPFDLPTFGLTCALVLAAAGALPAQGPPAGPAPADSGNRAELPGPGEPWPDPGAIASEEGSRPVREIGLREVVTTALESNLGLEIERLNPGDARDEIESARAAFDPTLTFQAGRSETRSPTAASTLDGAPVPVSERRDYSASATQRIPLGTQITAAASLNRSFDNSAFSTLNPSHFSELSLRFRQPLLRGLGAQVNLAPIVNARASLAQSKLRVRDDVLDVLAETERRYWSLSAAYARRAFTLSNFRLAEQLLEENVERQKLGVALETDVLQARASLAARREELILAGQAIEEAEDQLLVQMGLLETTPGDALAPAALPRDTPELPELSGIMRDALAVDLETEAQYAEIANRVRDREVARNGTLPDLDLVLDGAWQGRDSSDLQAVEGAAKGSGYRWRAALELSFGWGLRDERADLRQAARGVRRAELELARIRQDLLREVREAWRDVAAGIERQKAAQLAVRLNTRLFEQERERYLNGLATFRDVLEVQSDLDSARLRFLDATEQLVNAGVTLARLDGRLLGRHGFTWESEPLEPDARWELPPDPSTEPDAATFREPSPGG